MLRFTSLLSFRVSVCAVYGALLCSCWSSSVRRENSGGDFVVTKFLKVEDGYQYSSEKKIVVNGDYYFPKISLKYEKDRLREMIVYKPEGPLTYYKSDLKSDSLLLDYFQVDSIKKINLFDSTLVDNGTHIWISKRVNADTILCVKGDTLYRYIFNNQYKLTSNK